MRSAWAGALGLMAFGLACAGAQEASRYEDVLKEMIGTLDKISTTLANIKDRDSADAAAVELRKRAEEWDAVRKKATELPPPERPEKDRLAKAYRGRFDAAFKTLLGETTRVQAIPGGRAALQEIRSVMTKPAP
jgi:hypothetical protein